MNRPPRAARQRPTSITRRWFQLHLSTALLLMLSAGVLMGLNLKQQNNTYTLVQRASSNMDRDTTFYIRAVSHGWPCWTDAQFARAEADGSDFQGYTDFATSNELFKLVRAQLGIPDSPVTPRCINAGIALSILLALALACEFIIRMRRPNIAPEPARAGEHAPVLSADAASAGSSAPSESGPSAR